MDDAFAEHWRKILSRIHRRSPPIAAILRHAERVVFEGDKVRVFIPDEFADRVPILKDEARIKIINEVLASAVAPGTTLEIIVGTEVPEEPEQTAKPAKKAKAKKARARKRSDPDKSQRLGLPGFTAEDVRYRLGNEGEQIPDPW
ncbi:hypothetical protein LCGC14_1826700 [marine sediment metagenome]|uniref:Uncharacterized protein n=1 Tax=marine sediment metagenome TaxID=412755 RepID=A0A0F9GHJ9_9ZZZZ